MHTGIRGYLCDSEDSPYNAKEREETFESRGSEAKRKILCWTCGKATTHEVTWRFGERCYLCRDCGEIVVEKLDSFQKE